MDNYVELKIVKIQETFQIGTRFKDFANDFKASI